MRAHRGIGMIGRAIAAIALAAATFACLDWAIDPPSTGYFETLRRWLGPAEPPIYQDVLAFAIEMPR